MRAAEVDVVIPALNPGAWLRVAVDGVLDQTFPDWCAIVVDDGSSEDLSWVERVDSRVYVVRQENAGVSSARNRGIAEGSSPYVAFLDADDVWKPDKLSSQIAALEAEPAIGLCSTAFEILNSAGERLSDGYEGYAESYEELLAGNGICTSTTMVPRRILETVGNFDPSLAHGEDWDLWLRIARRHPVVRLDGVLAGYRLHDANTSADYWRLLREGNRILDAHIGAARARHRVTELDAAMRGRRRLRRLAGIQAFDQARASAPRSPISGAKHLGFALRFAPSYTTSSLLRKARNAKTKVTVHAALRVVTGRRRYER